MRPAADDATVRSASIDSTIGRRYHRGNAHAGKPPSAVEEAAKAMSAGEIKAGVIGLSKTAAKELARFGVTVNVVSPNAHTRMIESIPDHVRVVQEGMIPLGRFADPEEIVPGVMFLASPAAGYITGAVLTVDGGIAM